jgi:hypothetical protein
MRTVMVCLLVACHSGGDRTAAGSAAEPTPVAKPAPPPPADAASLPPGKIPKAHVELTSVKVTGSLDEAAARKVLEGAMADTTACYTKHLADEPTLAGAVSERVVARADGGGEVRRAGDANDHLEMCLSNALFELHFGKLSTDTNIDVTYTFSSTPAD